MRDIDGRGDVIQIENPISSVLPHIPGAQAITVERKRWRVIKTTADLLMVRADGLLKLHKVKISS